MKALTVSLALAAGLWLQAPSASADTLLIQRVAAEPGQAMPARGQTMAQVERAFGAPERKFPAVGGGSPQTPPITRWRYAGFTVYFENDHVVDAVVNRASPTEAGPRPVR